MLKFVWQSQNARTLISNSFSVISCRCRCHCCCRCRPHRRSVVLMLFLLKKGNRFEIFFLVSFFFFFFYFYCFLDRTTIREQTGDNLGRYIPFHSQFEFKAIQKLVELQKVPLIQSIPFQQAPNGECACVLFMCHPFIKLL